PLLHVGLSRTSRPPVQEVACSGRARRERRASPWVARRPWAALSGSRHRSDRFDLADPLTVAVQLHPAARALPAPPSAVRAPMSKPGAPAPARPRERL